MRLWRISNYADLSGLGGLRFSARWHTRGRPIVYAAEHPSAALTEMLVHVAREDLPDNYRLLTIDCPDDVSAKTIRIEDLPENWKADHLITRAIGDRWLHEAKCLLLRVPSAIVPDVWNILINPAHPDAAGLSIIKNEGVLIDPRLR